MFLAGMVLAAALAASPKSDPDLTPAPIPKVMARFNLRPWDPRYYRDLMTAALAEAKRRGIEKPGGWANEWVKKHRMGTYPQGLPRWLRKRLYDAEFAWMEQEQSRRDRVASLNVVRALAKPASDNP